jgi:hypothetical protein
VLAARCFVTKQAYSTQVNIYALFRGVAVVGSPIHVPVHSLTVENAFQVLHWTIYC